MAVLTPAEVRDANLRYHDGAAAVYDAKWSIDFDAVARAQTRRKFETALGGPAPRFAHALELGAGTGYFSLNLMLEGVIARTTAVDISPGMLEALVSNARRLGLEAQTVVADAEALPLADASVDLVIGHAILHHLPEPARAFAECHRVLRPGGTMVFAGEPSRIGDRLARIPKQLAHSTAPLWRGAIGAGPRDHRSAPVDHELETLVDVRVFDAGELAAFARAAGFDQIAVRGEDLLASWFGWYSRGLEATAEPAQVPSAWRRFAARGYLALARFDRRLLADRLPADLFYNLILCARRA
jgi:ubiquinone/menaquinone biosynthesis C-methylase UbiE